MSRTFEEAIELLSKTANRDEYIRQLPAIVEGFQDLASRLEAIEKSRHDDQERMQALESLTAEERAELTALGKDRTDLQHRVAELEHQAAAKIDPKTGKPYVVDPVKPVVSPATPSLAQTLGFSSAPTVTPAAPPPHA